MIIDFHAHVFPDELAPKAIHALTDAISEPYPAASDGTVAGLLQNMDSWGIDISVIQPVVTKQSQTQKINEWTAGIASNRLVCFGGICPHTDDFKRDIDFVVSLGLKGLKFHAEYQNFIIDDDYMLKIYDYALCKDLILLHHAGFDPAFQPPFKSSPRRFARIAEAMKGGVIIAAHLGGIFQWDDVENYLAGSAVYLDTSIGFDFFPHDQFCRIVRKHGADKVLFGSDAPWSNAKTEIERLKSMPLPKGDIDSILYGNARRILQYPC